MTFLSLYLFLIGWLVSYPLLWPLGNWVVTGFAPVMGWLGAGIFALISLWAGMGMSKLALGMSAMALAFGLWNWIRPPFPKRAEIKATFIGACICLAVCILSDFFDFHFFVPDSFTFTYVGQWAASAGKFQPPLTTVFLDFGALPIAWQSLAGLMGADYIYVLAPTLAVSLVSGFSILGVRLWASASAHKTNRLWAAALGVLFIATTPLFLLHSQTIHSILPASLFLLWFWAGVLLYFQERHNEWLTISFISLGGFCLCRVESPLFVASFLTLIYSDERMEMQAFNRRFHTFALLLVGYYCLLASQYVPHFDEILSPLRVALILLPLGMLLGLTIGVAREKRVGKGVFWKRLRIKSELFTLVALFTAVVGSIILHPNSFLENGEWILFNFLQTGGWGFTAVSIGVLLLWLRNARVPSWETLIWKALGCVGGIVILLGAARSPYRPSPWDTSNRLFLVMLPIVLLVVMGRWLNLKTRPNVRG